MIPGQILAASGRAALKPAAPDFWLQGRLHADLCRGARQKRSPPLAVGAASAAPESARLAEDVLEDASVPGPLLAQPSYTALKMQLLRRTQYCGAFLVVYLGVVASLQAAACSAAGACCGWLYLLLITSQVEQFTAQTEPPLKAAKQIKLPPLRWLALTAAAYRQSLRPRLLIPVGLFGGFTCYRQLFEHRLGLIEAGALLAGFLSFKGALVLAIWDGQKPNIGMGGQARHSRPRLPQFPKLEDE